MQNSSHLVSRAYKVAHRTSAVADAPIPPATIDRSNEERIVS
jgi:hypothetical protein